MEIPPALLQVIGNGSIATIMFIIWYLSFRQFHNQQERIHKQIAEHTARLFDMIEQDIRYKEILSAVFTRLETKIDIYMKGERS